MKDHYATLGLQPGASKEEIKKAYRRKAMEYHPDREGGDEVMFKEINAAYEALTNPRPRAAGMSSNSDDFTEFTAMFEEMARRATMPRMVLHLSLLDAFNGCVKDIYINGEKIGYTVSAGLPNNVEYFDKLDRAERELDVRVVLNISDPSSRFQFVGNHHSGWFSGDLKTAVDVDALDMLAGGWITVVDFTGKSLQVRIPSGLAADARLKVAQHGYWNWKDGATAGRGDLYITVRPKFSPIKELNAEKLEGLLKQVQEAQNLEELKEKQVK